MNRNISESEAHYQARIEQAKRREQVLREQVSSAIAAGDQNAELEAREALEALRYASQHVSDKRVATALQGATFGLSDEITAGLETVPDYLSAKVAGSPASFSDIYQENVTPKREALKQYQKEEPGESLGYDVGGGLLGVAALTRGMGGVPALARYGSKFAKLKPFQKIVLGGSGWGGVTGYGRTEGDIPEQAMDTTKGAGLGAGFALTLGGLGYAANKLAGPLLSTFKSTTNPAQKIVLNTLADDALPKKQAIEKLQQLGPQATIADLGPNAQKLAGSVARASGPSAKMATDVMETRVVGASKRLMAGLRGILKNDKNARTVIKDINVARKTQAGPLYKKAHSELLTIDDELLPLIRKAGQSTYNNAKKIYTTDPDSPAGVAWPKFNEIEEGKRLPLAVLDYMKRSLSGRALSQNTELSLAQGQLAKRLTTALNSRSSAYNQARQIYSDESTLLDAAKKGLNILKDDAIDVADDLARMSLAEQDAYRTSAIHAIDQQLKRASIGGDASRRIIRTEILKERLRNAFPDDESFNAFVSRAESENVFAQTRNEVLKGSQTQMRAMADAKLMKQQGASIASDVLDGNFGTAAKKTAGLADGVKNIPDEELATEIGKIIFAQGDDAVRLIAEIQKRADKFTPAQRQILERAFLMEAGGSSVPTAERVEQKFLVNQ